MNYIWFLSDEEHEYSFNVPQTPRLGDYVSFDDDSSYLVTRVEWNFDDNRVYLTLERE